MKICVGVNFEMSLNLCILATIIITSTIFIKKIIKKAKYGLKLYFLRILVCCVMQYKKEGGSDWLIQITFGQENLNLLLGNSECTKNKYHAIA